MEIFNNDEAYHGSELVQEGRLRGATGETDYFYFFCPKCPNDHVVRILEYGIHSPKVKNDYNNECMTYALYSFTLVFKFQCEKCGLTDFVKISNSGWPRGDHSVILNK